MRRYSRCKPKVAFEHPKLSHSSYSAAMRLVRWSCAFRLNTQAQLLLRPASSSVANSLSLRCTPMAATQCAGIHHHHHPRPGIRSTCNHDIGLVEVSVNATAGFPACSGRRSVRAASKPSVLEISDMQEVTCALEAIPPIRCLPAQEPDNRYSPSVRRRRP
jgi:hypothetical protein